MTNKIPFDVELWKSGKYEVVTRDGRSIKSLLIHDVVWPYPVSAIYEDGGTISYTIEGRYTVNGGYGSDSDLFLIPKSRKVWIAVSKTRTSALLNGAGVELNDVEIERFPKDQYHIIEIELPE